MGNTKARLVMVIGAFVVMGGAYVFKGWQLEKDAEQACATLIQGYRQVLSDQGEAAVDSLKFAIQARRYASHDAAACSELRSLARQIEADHDAKARSAPVQRVPAPTPAAPGPPAELKPAGDGEGEIKTR